MYLTQYVAKHELSILQDEITSLTSADLLEIRTLPSSDRIYSELRRKGKGEAEAIAWSLTLGPSARPLFVARDARALQRASAYHVPATDLMGLLVELIESGLITKEEARSAVDPWNDPGQQLGKPKNYKGFDGTFARRRSRGPYYY